jgi:anti-anti-sigma factor
MADHYSISASNDRGLERIEVIGELDMAAVPEIAEYARCGRDDQGVTSVVVDLGRVTFIDSSGVGALVRAKLDSDRAGKEFYVTGAHGHVARVLDVHGVANLFADPAEIAPSP